MSSPRYRRTDRNLHWWLLIAGLFYCFAMYWILRWWG